VRSHFRLQPESLDSISPILRSLQGSKQITNELEKCRSELHIEFYILPRDLCRLDIVTTTIVWIMDVKLIVLDNEFKLCNFKKSCDYKLLTH
jgi:hypothetical protein